MKAFISDIGQISVPPRMWREMHVKVGQTVRWEQISPTEYRITLLPQEEVKPDPVAALDFAREYGLIEGSSDPMLQELREGEED